LLYPPLARASGMTYGDLRSPYVKAGGLYHPLADWSSNGFSLRV